MNIRLIPLFQSVLYKEYLLGKDKLRDRGNTLLCIWDMLGLRTDQCIWIFSVIIKHWDSNQRNYLLNIFIFHGVYIIELQTHEYRIKSSVTPQLAKLLHDSIYIINES